MNLFDAEKFFKKYHGLEFHMAREDEKLYDEFKKMDIPKELIDQWKNDISYNQKQDSLKRSVKHLYVHVPFCNSICYYCDFCHVVYNEKLVNQWLDQLSKEAYDNCLNQYETIYIGGGTPSCLEYKQLKRLLNIILPYSNNVKEYTIEINPESITLDKIKLFKEYGINRISIGVQSSNDELLKSLNRKHNYEDVVKAVKLLKENDLNNISVDLMYSLPNQTIDILNQTIDDILLLDVPHISLYSLTIEENTVFGKRNVQPLDEQIEADMYELIENKLTKNNYIHYEVSNYCKKGYESKHNLGYWNYDDFLGISIGASSKNGNNRYTNTNSINKYLSGDDIKDEDLKLTNEELMFENIMMSLRTIYGLNIEEFNNRYNVDFIKRYKDALNSEYLKIVNNHLICTNLEILNNILLDFMI